MQQRRRELGASSQARGVAAERAVVAALIEEGWVILGRRVRTAEGEIDLIADRNGLTAFIEVKARKDLATAAFALQARQRARLCSAAAIVMAEHPEWGRDGIRFDVFLVDVAGRIRRIADAFRAD